MRYRGDTLMAAAVAATWKQETHDPNRGIVVYKINGSWKHRHLDLSMTFDQGLKVWYVNGLGTHTKGYGWPLPTPAAALQALRKALR